jgi:hypothetical protein
MEFAAPTPVFIADLDGDGRADLIEWGNARKTWMVHLSTGKGFTRQFWKGAWGSDGPIFTGDLNGDGKTDVFMWRDSDKDWMINLSTGKGFNAQQWGGAWGSDGPIFTGDLNGDGKTDVFMWRDSDKDWMINLSTGKGFNAQQLRGAWGVAAAQIVVGDFNGDRKADVLMYETDYNPMEINIATGSGFDSQYWRWTNPPIPPPTLCLGEVCAPFQICTQDACCRREDAYDVMFPEPGEPNSCDYAIPGVPAHGCGCRNPSAYGLCIREGKTPCGGGCCPWGLDVCRDIGGELYCSIF